MKKNFLFVAAFAAVLASCSQNEVDQNALAQKQITFSNLNDRATRATAGYHDGANDNGDDYKVYASSSLDGAKWYIEDTVWGQKDGDEKKNKAKNGPYYWLNGVTFDFYAYAPASLTATKGSGFSLSLNYKVPATADQDFTVATPVKAANEATGTVNLQFHHMLSKVTVSADLSNALKTAGYTLEAGYTANVTLPLDKGSIIYDASSVVKNNGEGLWVANSKANTNGVDKTTTYTGKTAYMVMPQAYNACDIQLKGIVIKKNGVQIFPLNSKSGDLKILSLKDLTIANNDGKDFFQAGKNYNLAFTINNLSKDGEKEDGKDGDKIFGGEITFNAEVADWANVTVPVTQP